jgi:hypothetical protein
MQKVPAKAQQMDAALSLPKLTWKNCLGMLTTFTCSAANNLRCLTLSFCIAPTQSLQVHPAKLTHALMSAAQEAAGAQLLIGTITGVTTAAGAVTGVKVQQQQQEQQQQGEASGSSSEVEVLADAVVLALGPWTEAARARLPTAPEMTGVHSITACMAALYCSSMYSPGGGSLGRGGLQSENTVPKQLISLRFC